MKKTILILTLLIGLFVSNAQSPHAARLYGMTQYGGPDHKGSIFYFTPETHTITVAYDFKIKVKGKAPKSDIVAPGNGKYYGTTTAGGTFNAGVIFEWDAATGAYNEIYNFTGESGSDARGAMQLYDGKLYGMTNAGGINGLGVIYEWDLATNTYTKKYDMENPAGAHPHGSLTLVGNLFYGVTFAGGSSDLGGIFEYNPATNSCTKKFDFDNLKGANPVGKLSVYNGKLYGMTNAGGTNNKGVIYEYEPATNTVTKKIDFSGTANGERPLASLTLYNNKFYGMTYGGGIYETVNTPDQGIIFEWNPANNALVKKIDLGSAALSNLGGPLGSFTVVGDKLWATATKSNGAGYIFEWNPANNALTFKHQNNQRPFAINGSFCEEYNYEPGVNPDNTLLLSGNKLLGTTSGNGGFYQGAIFELDIDSLQVTRKVYMQAADGSLPKGNLTRVGNKLFGCTYLGGNSHAGNIFEWDMDNLQYQERFEFDGYNTSARPLGDLTPYNGKLYGINFKQKIKNSGWRGNSANYDTGGEIFSWDMNTGLYDSEAPALSYSSLKLYNNQLYFTQQIYESYPAVTGGITYGGIFRYDPASHLLDRVAVMDQGSLNNFQDTQSANNITFFNGKYYGMTPWKGSSGGTYNGTIYEWDPALNITTHKYDFDPLTIGTYPLSSFKIIDGELYAFTSNKGNNVPGASPGGLFRYTPGTNTAELVASGFGSAGLPTKSGNKIYSLQDGGPIAQLAEYDPATGSAALYSLPFYPDSPSFGWYSGTCYQNSFPELLEVIPNKVPVLSNVPTAQTVCSTQQSSATFTISDEDLDVMNFEIASNNPQLIPVSNVSITNSGSTYTLNYTSNNNQTGAATITVTANDGYGGTVDFPLSVNVIAPPNTEVTLNVATLASQENAALSYQWMDCSTNSPIAGATNQSYTPTSNGSYAVTITTAACSDTSACIAVATLGLIEPASQSNISIAPNPASDFITISQNNPAITEIEIYNVLGKLIYKTNIHQRQTIVDLSSEAKGFYFIKATEENRKVTHLKIILQ